MVLDESAYLRIFSVVHSVSRDSNIGDINGVRRRRAFSVRVVFRLHKTTVRLSVVRVTRRVIVVNIVISRCRHIFVFLLSLWCWSFLFFVDWVGDLEKTAYIGLQEAKSMNKYLN